MGQEINVTAAIIGAAVSEGAGEVVGRVARTADAPNVRRGDGNGLCCTNSVRDSSSESSVVAGGHEQTHPPRLQDQELAGL